MLRVGQRFESSRLRIGFEVLAVPQAANGALALRLTLAPGCGRAVAHRHDDILERFVIESGTAVARLGGRALVLHAGEELEVPRGAGHVNPWCGGREPLVMRQVLDPATPFVVGFFQTLGLMMESGRVDRRGQLPLGAAFAVAHATGSRTYATGLPRWLQRRVLFPAGGWLARVRGYELALPAGGA